MSDDLLEGMNEEQLDDVSGGRSIFDWGKLKCPKCGSYDVTAYENPERQMKYWAKCNSCGLDCGRARFE